MSSNDPLKLIEQYLERVRVYLPLDSEDAIVELQTHLIEEAQRIGEGTMTAGSAMMAIERMGDPKSAANEYAGSGKKVGPVPAEYVNPVSRIIILLLGVGAAFTIGLSLIGVTLTQLLGADIQNWPFSIPLMIFLNLFIIFVIIGGLSLLDRDKPLTEKTTLESIFGIGVDGFKAKGRWDAAGDFIMGVFWGVVISIPSIVILYTDAFKALYIYVVVFLFLGAIRGALFYFGGENNFNLAVEAFLSVVWIALAVILIDVGWPIRYVYNFNGSTWALFDLEGFFLSNDIPFVPFDWIWTFIMFVTVVISVWRVFASSMKISMYLRAGKKLWWQGNWGERRRHRAPLWRRFLGDHEQFQQKGTVYHDGYREPEEEQ
jgi:uncharacterized membrane protein